MVLENRTHYLVLKGRVSSFSHCIIPTNTDQSTVSPASWLKKRRVQEDGQVGSGTFLLSARQGEELTERRLTSALCICSKDNKALGKHQSLCYITMHLVHMASQSDKTNLCQVNIGKRKIPLIQCKVDLFVPLGFQQEIDRCWPNI